MLIGAGLLLVRWSIFSWPEVSLFFVYCLRGSGEPLLLVQCMERQRVPRFWRFPPLRSRAEDVVADGRGSMKDDEEAATAHDDDPFVKPDDAFGDTESDAGDNAAEETDGAILQNAEGLTKPCESHGAVLQNLGSANDTEGIAP